MFDLPSATTQPEASAAAQTSSCRAVINLESTQPPWTQAFFCNAFQQLLIQKKKSAWRVHRNVGKKQIHTLFFCKQSELMEHLSLISNSAPLSLCSFPSISPPVSLLRYGMVGTVAGDGAPRSLSVVRSSGVCWTRPFSFSDSSLVGPGPFSLPLFHPARALCVVFVALCCHLRYWLGFYLN